MFAGDNAVVGFLLLGMLKVYDLYISGHYASLKYHTSGLPPALIAQDFSFDDLSSNRRVSPEYLLKYRKEANAKKGPVENFIFNY